MRVDRLLRALLLLGTVMILAAVRVQSSAARELAEGRRLEGAGALVPAIAAYRHAAHWALPGSTSVLAASDRLLALGAEAETRGERDVALAAYRSLVGASRASVTTAMAERRARAEVAIAGILATAPHPSAATERSVDERRADELARLQAAPRPDNGFGVLAIAAFAIWIVSVLGFIRVALGPDAPASERPVRLWGAVGVVAFGLFVIALALA